MNKKLVSWGAVLVLVSLVGFWFANSDKSNSLHVETEPRSQQVPAAGPTANVESLKSPVIVSPSIPAYPPQGNSQQGPKTATEPLEAKGIKKGEKELAKLLEEHKKARDASFASEAAAKEQIKKLGLCLTSPTTDFVGDLPANMPPELKAQMAQMGDYVHAECLRWGKSLSDKYPSLRDSYKKLLLDKASQQARKIAGE